MIKSKSCGLAEHKMNTSGPVIEEHRLLSSFFIPSLFFLFAETGYFDDLFVTVVQEKVKWYFEGKKAAKKP